MPHYSGTTPPVKRPRSQRKPILRIPEEMLANTAARFPEAFDRHAIVALFALRTLAQRITDYTNQALAPYGLNAAKFNYLMVLCVSPRGEMTLTELSRFIHTSNATVTSMVSALERDGLVERRAHALDGRSTVVRVSERGRTLMEAAAPVHHAHWAAALEDLSDDEREQLGDLVIRAGTSFDRHFGGGA